MAFSVKRSNMELGAAQSDNTLSGLKGLLQGENRWNFAISKFAGFKDVALSETQVIASFACGISNT
jgi:hypothetical protein